MVRAGWGMTMAIQTVTLKLTKPEALALKAGDTGADVIKALHLVPNTALIEAIVRKLRDAAR
jgi:hypothetical protein